ncbi:hypothetical protein PUMCH_004924 [Australozyma saopauloensis]|uniref:aspartyl aminopeptidase n=1 Tax=Australozyma saopauloensis TaxID=291208 RepID=A0AAX4HGX5_9ASCO|nr:hypothetical protein PUMCH_004924 [[Candida] saopauloensis]
MDTESLQAAQGFVNYINDSPTPYHAVANVKSELVASGFQVLKEKDHWKLEAGKSYVVTRNGSSLIAFRLGSSFEKGGPVAIVGAHTDSPCLKLKPISAKSGEGFVQVGVEQYGGLIAHSWFDRDLAIAGRVYVKTEDGQFVAKLLHIKKPLMRIPTLAIHLHREANTKFEFNKETEFVPIAGQEKFYSCKDDPNLKLTESEFEAVKHVIERHNQALITLIAQELDVSPQQIEDFELLLCDYQPATLGGMSEEFIFGPRQDNLTSCFAAAKALLSAEVASTGASLISLFDHEEIGSVSAQGADSSFLPDILNRLADSDAGALARMCSQSFVISSDQAHGVHPNYERFYEKANRPHVNGGPVIKINANQRYATNSRGIVLIKAIAERSKVPMQLFVVRNDSPCGSTIGPMLLAKLGIRVLDLGNPQLSMHSIRETGGSHDIIKLQRLFAGFFEHFVAVDDTVLCD